MTLTVGTSLGPYTVTAKIGEGGMGEMYQATDTKLNQRTPARVTASTVFQRVTRNAATPRPS